MYQKAVNAIIQKEIFNVDYNKRYIKRFVIFTSQNENKFDAYIMNQRKLATIPLKLQAISYNSRWRSSSWDVRPTSIWFFDKHGPVISQTLCDKIIRNIKREFMSEIKDMLLDYHILFHVDGTQYKISEYPSVYIAMGYVETFPIVYFEEDFTENEMRSLTKYLKGQVIIIALKQESKIKIYRDINKGNFVSVELPMTAEGLVQSTVLLSRRKIDMLQRLIDSMDEDAYKQLWSVLNK